MCIPQSCGGIPAASCWPCKEPAHLGTLLLQLASLEYEAGNLEGAISQCRAAAKQLPKADHPRWATQARFNLANYLMRAGRFPQAWKALEAARPGLVHVAHAEQVRVAWVEAAILRGLGRVAEAEAGYQKARRGFVRLRRDFSAALATLELALLLLEQGRTAEVAALALEVHPIFEREGVHREAQAAMLLLRDAAAQERLTAFGVAQLLGRLQQGQE